MNFHGKAKRLDDVDLPRVAARIGVGEDEIHAVLDVETAGSGTMMLRTGAVRRAVENLINNAVDAMSEQERDKDLRISLTERAERLAVALQDSGPGIEDPEKLFEPFYTTKQPGDGVGLGLAISSGIVNDHGGRLTARNGRSGGAVFEMQLPILEGGLEAAE